MASEEFIKRMTKNILNNSPKVSNYIFALLSELGQATSESFFSPKYSFTKPTRMLFGLDGGNFQVSKRAECEKIRQNLRRLRAQGIVKKVGINFMLTKEGKEIIKKIADKKKLLSRKWDGKYRLVIFDIPEKKRNARNWLRAELYMLEYSQLQMSVFIGKHPLTENIIGDIKHHGLEKHVNYLLVKNVYDKKRINNHRKTS